MAVMYLYINHKESETQTPAVLFGSLLKQLIQDLGSDVIPASVIGLYKDSKREIRLNEEQAIAALKSVIQMYYRKVYLVVDALDEFPENGRGKFLTRLESIDERVSLLVTSREFEDRQNAKSVICNRCGEDKLNLYYSCMECDYFDVCKSCKDRDMYFCGEHRINHPRMVTKEIRAPDNEIRDFIKCELYGQVSVGSDRLGDDRLSSRPLTTTRLRQLCDSAPELKLAEKIPNTIAEKAQGMYLLAKLQMETLKIQTTVKDLRKALDSLSTETDGIYGEMLKRIHEQSQTDIRLAMKALSWVVLAYRPLSEKELLQAMAVEHGQTEYDRYGETQLSFIFTATLGFLTADSDRGAVWLVHRTALEYFEQNWKSIFPEAPIDIATTILTYLNFNALSLPCKGTGESTEDIELDKRLARLPFLSYAATYWGQHMQKVLDEADPPPEIETAVVKLLSNPSKLSSMLQAAWYVGSNSQKSDSWDIKEGPSGLHVCAWYGLDSVLTALRENSPTHLAIDTPDLLTGWTPLMFACKRGHQRTVSKLLKLGANINMRSNKGSTAAFEAIIYQHPAVLEILLTTKTYPPLQVNMVNDKNYGHTPLTLSAAFGYERAVSHLLDQKDIHVNAKTSQGYSALALAAFKGHIAIVNMLLSCKDVDIDSSNEQKRTPLALAAEQGHEQVVAILLEHNARANWEDCEGNTALTLAIINGHELVVQAILDRGTDLNSLDRSGYTLLHRACVSENPCIETVRLLIARGAIVNARGCRQQTPLHDACRVGNFKIVQELLDSNADISLKDLFGRTPYLVAWQNGEQKILDLLHDRKVVPDDASLPIWSLAKLGYKDLLRDALDKKDCNLYVEDPDTGKNALHWAVVRDHTEITDMLLGAGMSPDKADEEGCVALHCAASLNRRKATQRILKSHPNLEKQDHWGDTPLLTAQAKGHHEIAVLLLEAGASLQNAQLDQVQQTFFAAVGLSNVKVVQQLMAYDGVDLEARNSKNHTALQIAKTVMSWEVRDLLREKLYGAPKAASPLLRKDGAIASDSAMATAISGMTRTTKMSRDILETSMTTPSEPSSTPSLSSASTPSTGSTTPFSQVFTPTPMTPLSPISTISTPASEISKAAQAQTTTINSDSTIPGQKLSRPELPRSTDFPTVPTMAELGKSGKMAEENKVTVREQSKRLMMTA